MKFTYKLLLLSALSFGAMNGVYADCCDCESAEIVETTNCFDCNCDTVSIELTGNQKQNFLVAQQLSAFWAIMMENDSMLKAMSQGKINNQDSIGTITELTDKKLVLTMEFAEEIPGLTFLMHFATDTSLVHMEASSNGAVVTLETK